MEKFVIIDGNNLMYRAFYALPQLSNFDGEISNAVFGFTNMLTKCINDISPKYIAVCFDVAKKNFRHEKFAEYKGTRKPTPDELKSQFPIVKEMLKKMKIQVVEKEGLEADDLMGCLSKQFDTQNIIVSADRDAFQLIDKNTSICFPKKGITETISLDKSNLKEHYGVNPEQVVDLKSLMGDASDNIPGVTGVGEKTALGLIDKYGTLDNIYLHIDEITGKLKEKLINCKDQAYLSKWLATIVTDQKLDYKLEDFEYSFPFSSEVLEMFKRYQFNSLIKRTELFGGVELKKEIVDTQIIDNMDKLNELVSKLNECQEFAIYVDNATHIYCDCEYKICCGEDLLSTGIDYNEFLQVIKPVLENEKIKKLVYDAKSLKHYFFNLGIEIKNIEFDCLIARYLINSIAKYNITFGDVMAECGIESDCLGYALVKIKERYYKKLEELQLFDLYYNIELPLMNLLFDMEIQGFKVDKDELAKLEIKYREEIRQIEKDIYDCAGTKFNIFSPKQLGEVLFDKLDLNIPTNKKKSTSIEVLSEIEHKHPIVPLIIRYRTVTKLYNTYILGFLNLLDSKNKIHTVFNQTITSTGRLSSSEPNLQNIPVRTEEGRGLRKVFVPTCKDGLIVSADYSQIELRLLASFSGDQKLIDAFNNGEDIHARTASEIFGVPLDDVTPNIRRQAKAINFGIVYGISDFGLSQNIGISRKEASNYIKLYFERYPKIEEYMKSNVDYCKQHGFIKTIFGRIRPIPEINSTNYNIRNFGERAAMNMPLQGSASDIIKLAMVRIFDKFNKQKLNSKIILQVHDELVVDCYPGELERVTQILKDNMENVVDLSVKLTVNIESGKTWYDAK
ncbi:MAG: DNA polymerase I [Firmicutes bacterium]|nr:DNA polymerase I [Bacillota bacterium]